MDIILEVITLTTHLIIPDVQVKPGHDYSFLKAIGNYIVKKRPDVIVNIGDFADMPSLSSYDKGKKSFEGRRYKHDVEAVQQAMDVLLKPLRSLQARQRKNKEKVYKPRMILTLGNHEHRIDRAVDNDSMLDGTISIEDLKYVESGWEVIPFEQPIIIDGVLYAHYVTAGALGRPVGSASAIISKKHQSCVVGHQQGRQVAYAIRADGKTLTAIIAGSCYEHDEDYMGAQGNHYWRGIVVLHEVNDGCFDEMFVSLDFLKKRYL